MNNDFPNETGADFEDNSKENVLTEESVTMKHSQNFEMSILHENQI